MRKFKTLSEIETMNVGFRLGRILRQGDVVCLNGDLGTGKTAFTSGIAKAFGIIGYITSPTFTLVNEYEGEISLCHFDVYRVSDAEEMFEIGFQEYLDGKGVVVIEWADLISAALPADLIQVDIKKNLAEGLDTRLIEIEFIGDRYKGCEEKLD